jgi:hypothetical protein
MITLWARDRLSGRRLKRKTREYLEKLEHGPVLAAQSATTDLLKQMANEPGPKVSVGKTLWGEPVNVPLLDLVKACGLTTGGMGAGKTMFAMLPIAEMIRLLPGLKNMSFGVLDAKGELFERALYLLGARLAQLRGQEREALARRIVVIDFSSREAVSPYNILARWSYTDGDFFVTSRLETLRELLPAGEKLSLRGAAVLKNILMLLAEFNLPLTYLEAVLADDAFRQKLLLRSKNAAVRAYFQRYFVQEGKQTIGALRARMEALFASEGVRLALSGSTAPDFKRLQNEGKIVLVNCAGPTITRGVRLLLQGLVLSDIRQSIFARPNNPPVTYLWYADEAQNFFLTKQQQENMADILTMARSFGSFFYFLCQNLSTAIPDARILEQLHTNIRWSLTLRGTPRDAQFLRSALPVSGRLERPEPQPFRERTVFTLEEERGQLLEGIAHLPDRVGYLWLKTRSAQAIKLSTSRVELPEGEEFRTTVDRLRQDATLGARLSQAEYVADIASRDREWLGTGEETEAVEERWENAYRRQEALCQE